jgi:hypothetical protein
VLNGQINPRALINGTIFFFVKPAGKEYEKRRSYSESGNETCIELHVHTVVDE